MHIKGKYSWLKHIDFMIIDLLVIIASFSFAYFVKFGVCDWTRQTEWVSLLFLICLLNLLISFVTNPYSGIFRRAYYEDLIKHILLVLYNLIAVCVVFYVLKVGTIFSREMFLVMYITYFIVSFLLKVLWKKLIIEEKITIFKINKTTLYVVAPAEKMEDVIQHVLATDFQQYEIIGNCDENGIDTFVQEVISKNVKEVLIAIRPDLIPRESLELLIANGIGVHFNIETIIGFQTEDQFTTRIGTHKTLSIGTYNFTPNQLFYFICKRAFDIVFGCVGLIVLVPLTIFVKISFLLNGDTEKIFYTQTRIGQYGRKIKIFKFRSMVPNADEILQELLKDEKYRKEWEENQKFENDPRITPIGKFIRATSIDEVPQFLNVLAGDMSLVGPRPLVEGELEAHGGLRLYNLVKPGITGWWGCNGRSNIDYKERLELEYYYVKHCSLYLDVLCVIRTIAAVLKRDGSK